MSVTTSPLTNTHFKTTPTNLTAKLMVKKGVRVDPALFISVETLEGLDATNKKLSKR